MPTGAEKRGSLIAIEGIDGAGKSTQARRLAAWLEARGHAVRLTREPTDGPVGARIRAHARTGRRFSPAEELALFTEDRAEHVRELIGPALEAGEVVVTDRYFLSTVAYQGARGLDWRSLLAESERRFPLPDLALLLVIDPEPGLRRVDGRSPREPGFEEAPYLAQVAAIFAAIDRPYVVRVDAAGAEKQVFEGVADAVAARIGEV